MKPNWETKQKQAAYKQKKKDCPCNDCLRISMKFNEKRHFDWLTFGINDFDLNLIRLFQSVTNNNYFQLKCLTFRVSNINKIEFTCLDLLFRQAEKKNVDDESTFTNIDHSKS